LRRVFLLIADWIWSFAPPITLADITPWARGAMFQRDGAEPYALIALVLLHFGATALAVSGIIRLAPRPRELVSAALLVVAVWFAWVVSPRPPLPDIARQPVQAWAVVVGSLAAALLVRWAMSRRTGIPAGVAVALFPMCLISTAWPSLQDLACVLAPALRIHHGFPLSQIYLQYDLFPSLLALGWSKVGASPLGFSIVDGAGFYALLLGLFLLGQRLLARRWLAAHLLIALIIVRVYGVALEPNATPQVTPIRLDLWPLLLAATLAVGIEHWSVGALLGALCLFSRSMGTLYLGAYALALVGDFFARRRVPVGGVRPPPFWDDVKMSARRLAPAIAWIALAMLVGRLLFGGFGSDAVRIYRQLGVGMLRVRADSFYWWLLPLTGAAGWLAWARRGSLSGRRGETAILAVALMFASSLYFFGRSHEHNLINTSAPTLFVLFLAIDLAWPAPEDGARVLGWVFAVVPWCLVAICGYHYSGRLLQRLGAQGAILEGTRPVGPVFSYDVLPTLDCAALVGPAGDSNVYLFSKYDFWYYQGCGLVPQGFTQPLFLAILKTDVVAELNHLLDQGYKIVVPRSPGDWAPAFTEFLPGLSNPNVIETPQFRFYRRPVAVAKP
jgi:hypothetical protein